MNIQDLKALFGDFDAALDRIFVQRKRLDPAPNITDAVFSLVKAVNRHTDAIHRQTAAIKAQSEAIKEAGETITKAINQAAFGDELLGMGSPIQESAKLIAEAINNHADSALDAGDMQ